MKKWPNLSIVIATYNNIKTLEKVISAMLNLEYPSQYEVIVVDDGSTDNTKNIIREKYGKNKKIKLISLPHAGVCKARNAGINASKNEIIINMDHDCIPIKTWALDLVKDFNSKEIGVVSSYGYYGGTSTAFKRDLLKKVGGYDEEYKYYREDTDLSFKIMELGYKFKLVNAKYEHDHKAVKPKGLIGLTKYVLQRLKYHTNDALLYKKHPNELCKKFLHVKGGFFVNPLEDFRVATGLWNEKGNFNLSSPRGITFIENKSPLHALMIVLGGTLYVILVKTARLYGSIKFGKLLV
ncbi:MAG: glycosyltransferase family A protein [Candidatus Diapherotrites archaeon]